MIRLIQRRLIVPRGDTGTFTIPVLAGKDTGDVSIFTVFDPLMHRKIFEKVMTLSGETLTMELTHGDTVNLPVGQYVWDIKFYTDPIFAEEKLIGGTEVDSYYAAFTLPVCEIRETGDNLLMSDDAPTGALKPGQIDFVTASINEMTSLKNTTTIRAAEADTSAQNAANSAQDASVSAQEALDSQAAALVSQQAAQTAAENAQASATLASQKAAEIGANLESKANIADLATVAFSGDYNDLNDKPTIPDIQINGNSIVDNGIANIPIASKNNTGVIKVTNANVNEAISNGGSVLINDELYYVGSSALYAFQYGSDQGALVSTAYQHWSTFYGLAKAAGVTGAGRTVGEYTPAAKTAIQTMLDVPAKADIPTNVSELQNDVGYLTQHQDISGKADKSEIPTLVSELTNDAGYLTSFTETDPTVPAWAKAQTKPTYTAAEVGAPTIQEMNSAISTAIGNVNSFDMAVVQALPTEDISTHTIYLVPKTGETNDVYDEYIYINNAWEMIGNTQIDLSNYVQKDEMPIEAGSQDYSFKTKSSAAIADGYASTAVGRSNKALGSYSFAEGNNTTAVSFGAHSCGANTLAYGECSFSEGSAANGYFLYLTSTDNSLIYNYYPTDLPVDIELNTGIKVNNKAAILTSIDKINHTMTFSKTLGELDHTRVTIVWGNIAIGSNTHVEGTNTIATGDNQHVQGSWNVIDTQKLYADIIGNGINTSSSFLRSNAYALTWTGDGKYAGDVYVGANADSSGGTKLAKITDIPDVPVQDIKINGVSIIDNGIANIPYARTYEGQTTAGVIGVASDIATSGIQQANLSNGIPYLRLFNSPDALLKSANSNYILPVLIAKQHVSTFYGLAKAAGDTTQSASSNAVGTYTTEAKAAIHTMLGIDPASIAAQVDIPLVETVSGTTPTITGQPNVRYVCGEVSTISITPPASGSVDVIFESGSTATTMTVPSTVKWPAWFDAEALEANTTYEVLITDGIYGSVMAWAT